jgi:hypothetical protein
MPRPTRLLSIAIAATIALGAGLLTVADARAQGNVQRCTPTNTTHTVILRLPGIKIAEQTCIIRFGTAGSVKAWVHTKWRRTSFSTRFRQYSVRTQLELRNQPDPGRRLTCRYAAQINGSRSGERTCETTPRTTPAHGWTGDGTVVYNVGDGTRVRGLHGSPGV